MVPIQCTQQIIPLRYILKNFFHIKNVLLDTLEYVDKLKVHSSILINFVQCSVWKKKKKIMVLKSYLLYSYFLIITKLVMH